MTKHFSKTWSWNNTDDTSKTSHFMEVEFDAEAIRDGSIVHVYITNIAMSGWDGVLPDDGQTQDHIVLATNNAYPPDDTSSPSLPISLPYPANLASLGGFAEMATWTNGGSPLRYFWNNNTDFSYDLPYTSDHMTVVFGWASFYNENGDITWTSANFKVDLDEFSFRPGMTRENSSSSWQSDNAPEGINLEYRGGIWDEPINSVNAYAPADGKAQALYYHSGWKNQDRVGLRR